MKESVGALSITNIVIVFILLFSGYLCLSINNTKAYNVKNELINIIQKHNGFNDDTLEEIRDYMNSVSYRTTGRCDEEDDGFGYTMSGDASDRGMFCIQTYSVIGGEKDAAIQSTYDKYNQFPPVYYYKIKVFFSIDLPILSDAFSFNLVGNTKNIFYPVEAPIAERK